MRQKASHLWTGFINMGFTFSCSTNHPRNVTFRWVWSQFVCLPLLLLTSTEKLINFDFHRKMGPYLFSYRKKTLPPTPVKTLFFHNEAHFIKLTQKTQHNVQILRRSADDKGKIPDHWSNFHKSDCQIDIQVSWSVLRLDLTRTIKK
jgi:hypothetical protein